MSAVIQRNFFPNASKFIGTTIDVYKTWHTIVHNYDDFADVTVFVHADPEHQAKFMVWVGRMLTQNFHGFDISTNFG